MQRWFIALRYFTLVVILALGNGSTAYSQPVTYPAPPSVIYYDCDFSTASFDSATGWTAFSSVSHLVYQAIKGDSLTHHITLIAREALDSAADSDAFVAPPDSATKIGADFLIGSTITGSAGSYQFKIFLEDGFDRTMVAEGASLFSSAAASDVYTACQVAEAQILPVINKIVAYEKHLRSNDPSLSIDPAISAHAANAVIPLDGSTLVTITAADYDGSPLVGRTINVVATGGTVAPITVTTDANGKATVNFTGGSYDETGGITATIEDEKLTSRDTTDINGGTIIAVGAPDTTEVWELSLSFRTQKISFGDSHQFDGPNESWTQQSSVSMRSVSGLVAGMGFLFLPTFTFSADNNPNIGVGIPMAGSLTGRYFGHTFKHSRGHDYFHDCDSWGISGSTDNGSFVFPFKSSSDVSVQMSMSKQDTSFELRGYMARVHSYQDMQRGDGPVSICVDGVDKDSMWTAIDTQLVDIKIDDKNPNASIAYDGRGFSISFNSTSAKTSSNLADPNNSSANLEVTDTVLTATLEPLSLLTAVDEKSEAIPDKFSVEQNYPNPFNPTTMINYQLPMTSHVTLKVYDMLGREVATLVDQKQNPGRYDVRFDGSNLASGVYIYRLSAGSYTATRKLMLLK